VEPFDENCCVAPRVTVEVAGEMEVGRLLRIVTTAVAEPPGPLAVMVAVPDAGSVGGAV
jgi:hypothetical protein